ncbi:MAG: site-specific DNA-methyltransferase, partial [Gallionella sp.]|nr:site-specific DNA-methyltransferase [Gallionella sp.]
MSKTLLEQLPEIVSNARKEAERVLENLESRHRVTLQTREMVFPAKDAVQKDLLRQPARHSRAGGNPDNQNISPQSGEQNPDALSTNTLDSRLRGNDGLESAWSNRLIYGDNLLAIAALLAGDEHTPSLRGKVDLIYIDPPFDSKADYRTKVILPSPQPSPDGRGSNAHAAADSPRPAGEGLEVRERSMELEQKPTVIEQFAYSDTWSDGTASYLAMITPRLILMRELLSDSGSIYVHLDWHVGHYVKIVMDEVFGKDNFVNEIIWHYRKWSTKSQNFQRNHDNIFWYGKNAPLRHFRVSEFQEQSEGTFKRWKGKKQQAVFDESGKRSATSIEDDTTGAPLADVWDADVWSISIINPAAVERVDYATQKPEQLLNRILEHSCPEGGLVADFFGGSGTTAAVAEKLGRRWITSDLGKPACMVMRKRLIDQNAQLFLYQAIGDYQVESAKTTLGRKFKVGDLSQIVLQLYGALPLATEDNPNRNLGYLPRSQT